MKNSLYFLSLVVLAVVVCTLPISHANSQEIVNALRKPMPEIPVMPEEEFKKSSNFYKEVPFNDENLAYSVRLPKKWLKQENDALSNFSLSNKVLGEVERFYGPVRVGERSYFSIQAVQLEYKLTAEQWLILYMIENGFTIEGIRTIDDKRVEVIYVLIDRDITFVASAVAQVSGNRVMFAQYVVPAQSWKEEASVSQRVVQSFTLDKIDDGFVEPMNPYQFLDVAEVKYPDSWELKAEPLNSVDRMSISLMNVARKNQYSKIRVLKGKMEVHLATEYIVDDIDEEIDRFINEMSIGKLVIQDEIEEYEDFTVDENMQIVQIKAYDALDKSRASGAHEYWLAVLYSGEYYYLISLLTPSRNSDYFDWARNSQTFRVLVENVRPLVDE